MEKLGSFLVGNNTAELTAQSDFAKFNGGEHLMVVVPDGHSTITVRTSEGKQITFAFYPRGENLPPQGIDIQHHTGPAITEDEVGDRFGDDQKVGRPRQKVICFSGGGPDPLRTEMPKQKELKMPVTLTTLILD